MATEDRFPTIRDLRDGLSKLVEQGLGDLPLQVIIAPDSTMQAVAKVVVPEHDTSVKPALLIEFDGIDGRLPMMMVSCDRMQGREMPTRAEQ